ncbi:MAG TPA: nucleotide exchange factor GrpE [Clostridiaceae bacterium]|nr:nucleotide exchange factor GrpE [Clostridiaceae bacterium]
MKTNNEADPKVNAECPDTNPCSEEAKTEEHASETVNNQEEGSRPEGENPEELLRKKDAELKDLFERLQRVAAEYDNFRKRTIKEKEKIYTDSLCDVAAKFLPIADNLERAIKAAENDEGQGLKEGIILVYKQLMDILDRLDIKPIEAVGKTFDPELHHAVMHVQDETQGSNIVVEEFQKGYIYKDEIVIRHSMVKVAN